MSKDRLFLLETPFEDPALPGESFYCPSGIRLEGLIAAFPALAEKIEIHRLGFTKPRQPVAGLLGEDKQSLPVLVLADDAPADLDTERHGDIRYVNDDRRILALLATRHGLPLPHP